MLINTDNVCSVELHHLNGGGGLVEQGWRACHKSVQHRRSNLNTVREKSCDWPFLRLIQSHFVVSFLLFCCLERCPPSPSICETFHTVREG